MWLIKRGEIQCMEFDPAASSSICKAQPAVMISNNAANRNPARVVVVPLTGNTGRQYPGEALVTVAGKPGKAMADQVEAADKARLKSQHDTLSKADLLAVGEAILSYFGMPR